MKLFFPIISMVASLSGGPSNICHAEQAARPYQATTYVYGDIVFDSSLMLEKQIGRGYQHQIENCSNESVQCLNGELIRIALPKNCEDFPEGQFYGDGLETRVIRVDDRANIIKSRPPEGPRSPIWLLYTVGNNSIIYAYEVSGLIGIYLKEGEDIVSIAQKDGLVSLSSYELIEGEMYNSLITFSAWGRCNGRLQTNPIQYSGPERPY